MPKTILLPGEPLRGYSFCVCALRGMGGGVFFSYYAATAREALVPARRWSGAQLLYVVRVIPKGEG